MLALGRPALRWAGRSNLEQGGKVRQNYCAECGVALTGPVPVDGAGRPASRHQRWCTLWLPAVPAVPAVPRCGMCHGQRYLDDRDECPRCDGSGEEPGARAVMYDTAILEGIRHRQVA